MTNHLPDTDPTSESGNDYATLAFAVIGLSGPIPGAGDPATLRANLRAGTESITFLSDEQLLAAGEAPERLQDRAVGQVT